MDVVKADVKKEKYIILNINGELFLFATKAELTRATKNEIEIICDCAYDESSELLDVLGENKTNEDLYNLTPFELSDVFEKAVNKKLNIDISIRAIEFEAKINVETQGEDDDYN